MNNYRLLNEGVNERKKHQLSWKQVVNVVVNKRRIAYETEEQTSDTRRWIGCDKIS